MADYNRETSLMSSIFPKKLCNYADACFLAASGDSCLFVLRHQSSQISAAGCKARSTKPPYWKAGSASELIQVPDGF